jgi:hypothetical protein
MLIIEFIGKICLCFIPEMLAVIFLRPFINLFQILLYEISNAKHWYSIQCLFALFLMFIFVFLYLTLIFIGGYMFFLYFIPGAL